MHRVSRHPRLTIELLLPVSVLVAGLVVFFTARAKIDSDEGNWIGTTRYFETLFVDHDLSPEAWADGYWTRTQPMVFRYVIGSWLWLRGHDLKIQNPNYDYSKNAATNRRLGLAPADDVLDDARKPARVMAALAVLMLYLVVRLLAGPVGGPVGGLAAAVLALGSPYLEENLIRAKAESTLMFFLLAALLAAIVGLRRAGPDWPAARWGVATGLLLGLAFGSKLTVVLALVAVALWGAAACLDNWIAPWRSRLAVSLARGTPSQARDGEPRHGRPWVWLAAVVVTTILVFIGSNPFLWPDPIGRTWLLFENRRLEMAQQQLDVPSRAVYDLGDRIELVWDRSVSHDAFAPSRLNLPLEAILTVVGAAWLLVRTGLAARGRPGIELLVLLWLACLWAGVSLGLGFLLPHYFVPTAMIATLLSGLAVGWSIQACRRLWLIRRASPKLTSSSHHGAPVSPRPPDPLSAPERGGKPIQSSLSS
jgi:ABC-type amino acid transport system permease subunit